VSRIGIRHLMHWTHHRPVLTVTRDEYSAIIS
jgi:hypothetical protein